MPPPPITQADLEKRVGVLRVRQLFANGQGGVDVDLVAEVIESALTEAVGIVRNGWPADEVEAVILNDPAVRRWVVEMVLGIQAEGDTTLLDKDGRHPMSGWYDRSEKRLTELAMTKRRSVTEGKEAGRNRNTRSRVAGGAGACSGVFASSPKNPRGVGGF